jgi:hypothetical protein
MLNQQNIRDKKIKLMIKYNIINYILKGIIKIIKIKEQFSYFKLELR